MFKVNSDDVSDAKSSIDLLCDDLETVVSDAYASSGAFAGTNSGDAAEAQTGSMHGLADATVVVAETFKSYAKNLDNAHAELVDTLSPKRSEVASALGGTLSDTKLIVYDDSQNPDAALKEAFSDIEDLISYRGGVANSALGLDNSGGERDRIVESLERLSAKFLSQRDSLDHFSVSWSAYKAAISDFDHEYKGKFKEFDVDRLKLPMSISQHTTRLVSDFIKYTRKPSEMLKTNPLTELVDEFKEFTPYHSYLTRKHKVKGYTKHNGTKVKSYTRYGSSTLSKSWSDVTKKLSSKGKWFNKYGGKNVLSKVVKSKKVGALGEVAGGLGHALGVVDKGFKIAQVGSAGVSAFHDAGGGMAGLQAGARAVGREGTKVVVSTAASAIARGAAHWLLASAAIAVSGPFAPIVVAAVVPAVEFGLGFAIDAGSDWFAGKLSDRLFGVSGAR